MLHSDVLIRQGGRSTTRQRREKLDMDTQKDNILRVLKRAAADDDFIAQLTYQGSKALRGYNLSKEAKAALLSGDIAWVEAYVGRLSARLRTWFDCRLQQEIW
jgi:hypothetical protein